MIGGSWPGVGAFFPRDLVNRAISGTASASFDGTASTIMGDFSPLRSSSSWSFLIEKFKHLEKVFQDAEKKYETNRGINLQYKPSHLLRRMHSHMESKVGEAHSDETIDKIRDLIKKFKEFEDLHIADGELEPIALCDIYEKTLGELTQLADVIIHEVRDEDESLLSDMVVLEPTRDLYAAPGELDHFQYHPSGRHILILTPTPRPLYSTSAPSLPTFSRYTFF